MKLCAVRVYFAHYEVAEIPTDHSQMSWLPYVYCRAAFRADTTMDAGMDKHSLMVSPKEHLCLETSTSQRPAEAPGLAPCTRQWKSDFSCNLTGHAACVQQKPAWTHAGDLCGGLISVVVTVETVKCSLVPQFVFYGVAVQLCCFEKLL